MKYKIMALTVSLLAAGAWWSGVAGENKATEYVLIGWNSLGMHCINPSFDKLAILPPANTLMAQAIRRGNPPAVITDGVRLSYRMLNNNSSVDHSNFWQYAPLVFNAPWLTPGMGLTGNRLQGEMAAAGDHFEAAAIPVLPYDNNGAWNPYQVAQVSLKDWRGAVSTTHVVLPVSDELHCDQCHADGGDGTMNIVSTPSVEENILRVHDYYHPEFALEQSKPVLCAGCHADPALNTPGTPGTRNLSLAMHGWHRQFADAQCYSCHPGPETRCLRTAIASMGPVGTDPNCQRCHGTLQEFAAGLQNGRQPWAEEPTCAQCHGPVFDTAGKLYRESAGHGGIRCTACHNSPHAWWPSKLAVDNLQPVALQGSAKALRDCAICHTAQKAGTSPHPPHGSATPAGGGH